MALGSTSTPNGGRLALSGFLYQIVGALWLRANARIKVEEANGEIEALAEIVRHGTVEHEALDDDARCMDFRSRTAGSESWTGSSPSTRALHGGSLSPSTGGVRSSSSRSPRTLSKAASASSFAS